MERAPPPDAKNEMQRKLDKFESLAMLQQPLDAQSDAAGSSAVPVEPKPVALSLALRRGRLAIITVLMIAVIVALTIVFWNGLEVKRFDKVSMGNDDKEAMVDRYNSYSGNIATAFGKPVELFVATTVQVIALRLMASAILKPEPDWKVTMATLLLSAGVGYLIGNGFNALNVQVRDMQIQPIISPSDLTAADFANAAYAAKTSNMTYSVAETSPENPTTNTVLRNFMLPRTFKKPLQCSIGKNVSVILADDTLEYGLSQRDWMKTMLPEAVDATTQRVIINPTSTNANANVTAADMPMNASTAAYLLLNTMFLSSQFVPWGQNRTWDDDDDLLKPYQTSASDPELNVSTAVVGGVLPPDLAADETTKRQWFLKNAGPVLTDRFQETTVTKLTDIPMDLIHIQLGPGITFDAISYEVDVDPARLTSVNSTDKSTRYTNLLATQCSPFPGHCLIAKRDQPPSKPVMPSDLLYDAPAQIHAFAVCLDSNGTEALQTTVRYGGAFDDLNVKSCPSTSNTSMLLVSVSKRLVADQLLQNTKADASGLKTDQTSVVAVNLRKIYTFTVARLGWTLTNLANEFDAICRDTVNNCVGLTFGLEPNSAGTKHKLLIGADVLPPSLLTTPVYSAWASVARQRPVTLVQVNEPPKKPGDTSLDNEAGDLLLPHNIGKLQWDTTARATGGACSTYAEDRLQLVLGNHMYMERTLQSTYTAGMFFLFQQAVVKDVINVTATADSLQFDNNLEQTIVWVSIPNQNAILTLSGCTLLVLGVVLVVLWPTLSVAKKSADPLTEITTAHVIAHVMLDENAFPPALVRRRVIQAAGVDNERRGPEEEVDKFVIGAVSLQPQDGRDRATSLA